MTWSEMSFKSFVFSWWPVGSIKKKDFPENMNILINVMKYLLTNIKSLDLWNFQENETIFFCKYFLILKENVEATNDYEIPNY